MDTQRLERLDTQVRVRLFVLFRLFHAVRPDLLRDISRSLVVLFATLNILIYSRNNYLIFVLAYAGFEPTHPRPVGSNA